MLNKEVETACLASLDRWMEALNALDADGMDREMHFPHVRLAADSLTVFDRPGLSPMGFLQAIARYSGWRYSRWNKRTPIQASDVKVHMAVTYTRYRADESAIGVYDSLYVMTLKDGMWKTQVRSSFGP